jgi:hypothetical protein
MPAGMSPRRNLNKSPRSPEDDQVCEDGKLLSCSGGINPAEGMKVHAFFRGVDWQALLQQGQKAPFVPDLDDSRDCCMFQEFSERYGAYNFNSSS